MSFIHTLLINLYYDKKHNYTSCQIKHTYINLLLIYTILNSTILYSQSIAYKQYSNNEGLISNTVYDIIEDDFGYMWFCTNSGLVRFDGGQFNTYLPPSGAGKAGGGLKKDAKGNIWYNDFTGQVISLNDNRTSLSIFKPIQNLKFSNIALFDFDKTSTYLYARDDKAGIFKININNSTIINKVKTGIYTKYLNVIDEKIITPDMRYNQFTLYDCEDLKYIDCIAYPDSTYDPKIIFTPYSSDDFFITSFETKQKTSKLYHYTKNGEWVQSILQDKIDSLKIKEIDVVAFEKNLYWIGTNDGMYIFKKNTSDQIILIDKLFDNTQITRLYKDKEDNIWIATISKGIYYIPELAMRQIPIASYAPTLSEDQVYRIIKDNNDQIYFVHKYDKTIFKMNPTNYEISKWASPNVSDNSATVNNLKYIEATEQIALCSDDLYLFNKDGILTHQAVTSRNIIETPYGNVFLRGGLVMIEFFNENKKHLFHSNISKEDFWRERGTTAGYDTKRDRLWIGFNNGLTYFQNNQKKTILHYGEPIQAQSVQYNAYQDLLYVVTPSEGIYMIKDTVIIDHINKDLGIINENILDIVVNDKDIWIATEKSLQNYDIINCEWKNILRGNGFFNANITDFIIADKNIILATNEGLKMIESDSFNLTIPKPKILITALNGLNTTTTHAQLSYVYDPNKISRFDFNSICYKCQNEFSYRYELTGQSHNWGLSQLLPIFHTYNYVNMDSLLSKNTNFAIFSPLNVGHYTFKVWSINQLGEESINPATVNIEIRINWLSYLPTLIITLLIFFFILGLYIFNQLKENQLALKNKELESNWLTTRLQALNAQMNPHFAGNALTSIQELILFKENEKANKYLIKFSRLMRQIFDMSIQNKILLSEEITALENYISLEALRFQDNFEYTIEVSQLMDVKAIYIPPVMIQPFVENAIRHGLFHKIDGMRKLTIKFELHDINLLVCQVIDNGIGRAASGAINKISKNYTNSTANIMQRIEILNTQNAIKSSKEQKDYIKVEYKDLILDDNGNEVMGTIVEISIIV